MEIQFHRTFKKHYKKLSASQQHQVDNRLELFMQNPGHPTLNNHALKGLYKGYRSINITGDLRALYEPVGNKKALFILVDTHSNLYK